MGRPRKKLPLEICIELSALGAERGIEGADIDKIDSDIIKNLKLLNLEFLSSDFLPEYQAKLKNPE